MDEGEIRSALRELIETWHATAVPAQMNRRAHVLIGLTVYGLTAHTYTAVEGALTLHDAGQHIAATPLARQALECATTAAWVELAGYPAALALLTDQARHRRSAVDEFVKAGVDVDPDLREQLAADLAAAFTTHTTAGQKFNQRCAELEGGGELYAVYRAMSATCHAGADVVDLYVHKIEPTAGNVHGVGLDTRPKVGEADRTLRWLLISVVVATSAWSRLDASHTHRTRMKELHRLLGTAYKKKMSNAGFRGTEQRRRELKKWEKALRAQDSPRTNW